jgi:predicted alpha-1,6-mannanase (GH76 family)
MPVRCHEASERVERHLDYKYNYCLFLNIKVRVNSWLALNFYSQVAWVRFALFFARATRALDVRRANG